MINENNKHYTFTSLHFSGILRAIRSGKEIQVQNLDGDWVDTDGIDDSAPLNRYRVKHTKPEYRIVFTIGIGFSTIIRGDVPHASPMLYLAAKERLLEEKKAEWVTPWMPIPRTFLNTQDHVTD